MHRIEYKYPLYKYPLYKYPFDVYSLCAVVHISIRDTSIYYIATCIHYAPY